MLTHRIYSPNPDREQNDTAHLLRHVRRVYRRARTVHVSAPEGESVQGGQPNLSHHHAARLCLHVPGDGGHLSDTRHLLVHRYQMDAAHGLLRDVHGAADEDLARLADLPRQVRAQGEAHRQAAAAVDGPDTAGHVYLPWHLDTVGTADRRTGKLTHTHTYTIEI